MNPLNILKSFNQIHKFIKQKNINIVHSHHRLTNFFLYLLKIIKTNPPKIISTAHNVFPNLHKFGFWPRNTICVSTPVKEYINKVSNSNTILVYNSIYSSFSKSSRKSMGFEKEKVIFINVGRLTDQKSQIDIVKIAKKIEEKKSILQNSYLFLIIGDGPNRKKNRGFNYII